MALSNTCDDSVGRLPALPQPSDEIESKLGHGPQSQDLHFRRNNFDDSLQLGNLSAAANVRQPKHYYHPHSTSFLLAAEPSPRRRGFSLLELTITLLVLAIAMSVAIPQWVQAAERQQLRSATRLIENDLRAALRSAAIRSRAHTLSVQTGTGTLTISPALAGSSAPASQAIDYALRFNGLAFLRADFDGSSSCKIDIYQRLVNATTNQPLSSATLQIQLKNKQQTLDLLALLQTPTASSVVTSGAVTP